MLVSRKLGVNPSIVNEWWKGCQTEGWQALWKRRSGRRYGAKRKFTSDPLKLQFARWSRETVRDLIELCFGVGYELTAMSSVHVRWDFTPQQPVKRPMSSLPGRCASGNGSGISPTRNKRKRRRQ